MTTDVLIELREMAANTHQPGCDIGTLRRAIDEIERLRDLVADYEQMQTQHREHVRRLDVALNGDGAAKQASLVDLVSQFERR